MSNYSRSNWSGKGFDFTLTQDEQGNMIGTNADFEITICQDKARVKDSDLSITLYNWGEFNYEAYANGLSRIAMHPMVAAFQVAYNLI